MKVYIENRSVFTVIMSLITVILSMLSLLYNDVYLMWFTVLLLFFILVYDVGKSGNKAIVFGGFLISFFTFLIGKYALQMLAGDIQTIFSYSLFFEEVINVYLSLLALLVGYIVFKRKTIEAPLDEQGFKHYKQSTEVIGYYARILFYICILFSITVNIDIASQTFGNLYLIARTVESRLPILIQKIGQMSPMFFWIFLSTLPSKKQFKIPCLLFVFCATLTLFTGSRNAFVVNIMVIAMYVYFRHSIHDKLDEDIWLSRTIMIPVVLLVPIMVVFLGFMANIRLGENVQYEGMIAGLMYFFDQQGGSADVIGRGLYCKESGLLPDTNQSYTMGPIINYFRNGFLGQILGYSLLSTSSQDVALATYGNNLGATVTYLMAESYYFIGGGFGTCYVAELAVDFGYAGVIIYNFFLGWLFNNINYFRSEKWWKNALGLLIIRNIIFMPRDFALGFIASLLSVTNLLPLLILLILEKYMKWRPREVNNH